MRIIKTTLGYVYPALMAKLCIAIKANEKIVNNDDVIEYMFSPPK